MTTQYTIQCYDNQFTGMAIIHRTIDRLYSSITAEDSAKHDLISLILTSIFKYVIGEVFTDPGYVNVVFQGVSGNNSYNLNVESGYEIINILNGELKNHQIAYLDNIASSMLKNNSLNI